MPARPSTVGRRSLSAPESAAFHQWEARSLIPPLPAARRRGQANPPSRYGRSRTPSGFGTGGRGDGPRRRARASPVPERRAPAGTPQHRPHRLVDSSGTSTWTSGWASESRDHCTGRSPPTPVQIARRRSGRVANRPIREAGPTPCALPRRQPAGSTAPPRPASVGSGALRVRPWSPDRSRPSRTCPTMRSP